MPIEVVVSFEDGSSDLYYIPNDLLHGYKSFNEEVYLMNPGIGFLQNMSLWLKEIKK